NAPAAAAAIGMKSCVVIGSECHGIRGRRSVPARVAGDDEPAHTYPARVDFPTDALAPRRVALGVDAADARPRFLKDLPGLVVAHFSSLGRFAAAAAVALMTSSSVINCTTGTPRRCAHSRIRATSLWRER